MRRRVRSTWAPASQPAKAAHNSSVVRHQLGDFGKGPCYKNQYDMQAITCTMCCARLMLEPRLLVSGRRMPWCEFASVHAGLIYVEMHLVSPAASDGRHWPT